MQNYAESTIEFKDDISDSAKLPTGLTDEIIRLISKDKNEPEWMLEKRLKAFQLFQKTPLPKWGPSLEKLKLNEINYYISPESREAKKWEDVPKEIRTTFEKLGIPEAEKKVLAGVGAQLDSGMIYHNLKKELTEKGVIFLNMDEAVHKYPHLVKKYFMTSCVPISDHKFAMLHAAVWSGGTFIYVPKGVKVEQPLQAYFRMNAKSGGQFEHTLIIIDEGADLHYIEGCSTPRYGRSSLHAGCVEIFVMPNARMRYTSIENWSKDTFNLNTKRAIVESNAIIEWINSNVGSQVTMLYPCSVLKGEGARSDSLGVAMATKGQNQDTGSKSIHLAPNTTSVIKSKSISKDGGIASYRGNVVVTKNAVNSKVSVSCDALLLDQKSKSNTYPSMKIDTNKIDMSHEASVGKISEEQIYYLQSRGMSEEEAIKMIVNGFVEPVTRKLPLEYAVEFNRLIEIEMEDSIG